MHLRRRIEQLLPYVAQFMMENHWQMLVAESCTGGNLSGTLTALPGSSKWFKYGLVTYSNEAKIKYLYISPALIAKDGAVSANCALAMVEGLGGEKNDFCLAVTGFAGPEGERIGNVYIAWRAPDTKVQVQLFHFVGNRQQVITQVIYQALRQAILSSLYPLNIPMNCFFALNLEDESLQQECLEIGLKQGFEIDELEPMNNLHMTLSYIGHNGLEKLHELKKIGDEVENISAFDIHLSSCEQWKRAKCFVLKTSQVPNQLEKLLLQLPQGSSNHPFIPHITIAKRHLRVIEAETPIDVVCPIKSFSLMLSFHGIFYIQYCKWSLTS